MIFYCLAINRNIFYIISFTGKALYSYQILLNLFIVIIGMYMYKKRTFKNQYVILK